eukprot:9657795-Heterocapsa_arctica.AAC.1
MRVVVSGSWRPRARGSRKFCRLPWQAAAAGARRAFALNCPGPQRRCSRQATSWLGARLPLHRQEQ